MPDPNILTFNTTDQLALWPYLTWVEAVAAQREATVHVGGHKVTTRDVGVGLGPLQFGHVEIGVVAYYQTLNLKPRPEQQG